MTIYPESIDTDLSRLLTDVQNGSMQLPEFQRDWVWDDDRIRGIIASLSQGYPNRCHYASEIWKSRNSVQISNNNRC